jgi:hypothetical protein
MSIKHNIPIVVYLGYDYDEEKKNLWTEGCGRSQIQEAREVFAQ